MKQFILTLLILLVFFLKPAISQEADYFVLNVNESSNITQSGIEKFLIVNPEILEATLETGALTIKGLKQGRTLLHLWKNNEIFSYIITVNPAKIVKNDILQNQRTNYNTSNPKLDYGYYNVNAASNFNNNSSQSLTNNFYYRLPLLDGNLHFRANILSRFSGFNKLENFLLDNLNVKYNRNNLALEIGDINTNFPGLYSNSNSIRGVNISYLNKLNSFSFFSGYQRQPLNILGDNNNGLIDNRLKTGVSARYFLNEFFNFKGGFFAETDFRNLSRNNNVLIGGVNFNYPEIFSFNNDISTNFSGMGIVSTTSFGHQWEKRGESIAVNLSYSNLSREYLKNNNNDFRESMVGNINLKHISGLNFSTGFSTNVSDNYIYRQYMFRTSKNFTNLPSIYFNYRFNSINNLNTFYGSNNFEVGLNNNKFIPFSLSYFLITAETGSPFYSNNLRLSMPIFRNEFSSINIMNLTSINNNLNNSEISRRLSSNLLLNYNLKLIRNLDLGTNLNYSFFINDWQKDNIYNDHFSLSVNSTYHLPNLDKINFSAGLSFNNFSDSPIINTRLGYAYNFGKAARSTDIGDINGIVYEDSNDNQVYDLDEKIIPGIVLYTNDKRITSDNSGFYFKDLDYGAYNIILDKNSLPEGYRVTTQLSETVKLYTQVKEVNFGISSNLPFSGKVYRSKSKNSGLENIKVILDNNESILTDSRGNFQFKVKDGKHTVKLDTNSIPANYILQDKDISQDFSLTTKDEPFIEFTFNPIRALKGTVFYASHPNQVKPNGSKRLVNSKITIKYIYEDGEKEETIVTNEKGEFYLDNLEEGRIEISTLLLKQPIKVEIPDSPVDLNIPIAIYDEKLNLRNKKVRTSSRMSPIK